MALLKKSIVFLFIPLILSIASADFYITIDNMYPEWFKDTVERCYLVIFNGTRLEFTSYSSDRIDMELDEMTQALKKLGYTWNDVMVMIHNHFANPRFSDFDIKTYWRIKELGFHGVFSIYITSSGKVFNMRQEKKQ